VRTRVRTAEGWRDLQQYLVLDGAEPPIEDVAIDGAGDAAMTPEVRDAIVSADAIVIGPSNPVISIGPILAVPGIRGAMSTSAAPVVAVSPYVGGKVVKGPTDKFMRAVGRESSATGVAAIYEGLLDGLVLDAADPDGPPGGIASLVIPTLMDDRATRREVARQTLEFARSLK
jgi:LPPG:FO 2-phospho-L-lactate transferase